MQGRHGLGLRGSKGMLPIGRITCDTDAALALYGSDPSFMADYADAFIGRGAVKVAYTQVFKTIRLNGRFSVHEIVDMGGDLLSDW
jgi:hypothetical protein